MNLQPRIISACLLIGFFLSACGPSQDSVATLVAANIGASQTAVALTPSPTSILIPSATITPTSIPTATSTYTPIPTPTFTPTPARIVVNATNAGQLSLLDTIAGFEDVDGIILSPDGAEAWRVSDDNSIQKTSVQLNVPRSKLGPDTWSFASPAFSEDMTMYISRAKDTNGYSLDVLKVGDHQNLLTMVRNISGYTLSGFTSGFSKNSKYLVSISHEQRVWSFPKDPSKCSPNCTVTFSYKSILAAIYQLPSMVMASKLAINTPELNYVDCMFSPDNTYLATLALKGLIPGPPWLYAQIWQVSDGSLYRRLDAFQVKGGINATLDFSPNGNDLAFFDGENLKVWRWKSNSILWSVKGSFSALDYSPDGSIMATSKPDGSIQVWDAQAGVQIATLQGHEHPVTDVGFSPDGTLLVTLDDSGVLKLWNISN